jgi:ketosteroid isomerase-like protein
MTNLEIVEKAYDLFGKGDMDSLRALMDDKISFITYGDYSHAGSYVGPDEVIEKNFSVLAQNIPTLSITPIKLWESGGTIFVRVEATDGDIKSDSIHVWTLEGEKLKTFEAFEDTQTIAKMIKS